MLVDAQSAKFQSIAPFNVLKKLMYHPILPILSLGGMLSLWIFYIQVTAFHVFGFYYLLITLSFSGFFICTPFIVAPILRITRKYHLVSLADILAFRYNSALTGQITILSLLMVHVCYLALQLIIFNHIGSIFGLSSYVSLVIFLFIVVFTLTLQLRLYINEIKYHPFINILLSLLSFKKLLFFVSLGLLCLFDVFNGPVRFDDWLSRHPLVLQSIYPAQQHDTWQLVVVLMVLMMILMPHMFHIIFFQKHSRYIMRKLSIGMSLYILPLILFVPIIDWAILKSGLNPLQYDILAIFVKFLNSPFLTALFLLTIISALLSQLFMSFISLAGMSFQHLVIGRYRPQARYSIECYIQQSKFILIVVLALVVLGIFYLLSPLPFYLVGIGIMGGILLPVPALLGLLFWSRGTASGANLSLGLGSLIWLTVHICMALQINEAVHATPMVYASLSTALAWLEFKLLCFNTALFIAGSLGSKLSSIEKTRAKECQVKALKLTIDPPLQYISATSVAEVERGLSQPLGQTLAQTQVQLALKQLNMSDTMNEPHHLARLREQLQHNLSSIIGPGATHDILNMYVPYLSSHTILPDVIERYSFEQQLDAKPKGLSREGMELNQLRRFHRQTLQELPVGVCSVNADMSITGWNRAMQTLTGLGDEVIGQSLVYLPAPWGRLFYQMMHEGISYEHRKYVTTPSGQLVLNLHYAMLANEGAPSHVLVAEDTTEITLLEDSVKHHDRLAAIGRVAAGVAHEIGNPVAGIDGLAQNLRADFDDPEIQEVSRHIISQTQRIRHIVGALVGYARTDTLDQNEQKPVDLHELVQQAIHFMSFNQLPDIKFVNDVPPRLTVLGYRPHLHQVFVNLFSNAIDARLPDQPLCIHIRAEQHMHSAHIEVEDNGSGLPPNELRERLFEPFVTTKAIGQGTGLGLALVQSIVHSHTGHIQLIDKHDYDQGQGVIVQLTLPTAVAYLHE